MGAGCEGARKTFTIFPSGMFTLKMNTILERRDAAVGARVGDGARWANWRRWGFGEVGGEGGFRRCGRCGD